MRCFRQGWQGVVKVKGTRKALLGALLLCMLLPAWARAEVRIGQESPADWAGKDVLRLTQLDTNRSDCLLLESGHEHLDYLFNTHPHDDHIAVTIELVKNGLITADAYLSPFEQGYSDKHGYQQRMERALAEASIPYTMPQSWHSLPAVRRGHAHRLVCVAAAPAGGNLLLMKNKMKDKLM